MIILYHYTASKSSFFAENPPFISENKGSIDRVIEMFKNYLVTQQIVSLFPTVCCFYSVFAADVHLGPSVQGSLDTLRRQVSDIVTHQIPLTSPS
jgi:hypothetical protein